MGIFSFTSLLFINCATSSSKTQLRGHIENYKTEGWLDDDTFQVKGLGAPNPNARGFVRRRTQAKEAALLAAQKRVVELMVGAIVQGASGSDSGESTGLALTKELEGFIRGGQIVQESYDEDDNCELVFRIHSRNLKKKTQAMVSKKNAP